MSQGQALTPDELARIPFPLTDTGYQVNSATYYRTFTTSVLTAQQPEGPWRLNNGTVVTPEVFTNELPNHEYISNLDLKTL